MFQSAQLVSKWYQSPANPRLAWGFAGSTPAASTSLRPVGLRLASQPKKSYLPELTHFSMEGNKMKGR
jgi:hypothetical protein